MNEVKESLNQQKPPAIAILDNSDGGSESAVDATDITIRKDAAKTVLSLRESTSLHRTGATEEAVEKGPNKADQVQQSKKRKATMAKEGRNGDIPNVEDDYKVLRDSNDEQPNQSRTVCHAGLLCHDANDNVILQGDGLNGSPCCKCHQTFHHVCLYLFKGHVYCTTCYKQNVVSQCSAETLFEDVLVVPEEKRGSAAQKGPKHTATQLEAFIDKFLNMHGLKMTVREFHKWKKGAKIYARNKQQMYKNKWKPAERLANAKFLQSYASKVEKYEMVIKLAKEEWLLSMDGVVNALRYRARDNHFVAKVQYKRGTTVVQETITVPDDWVIDTYGKELAKKLIDRDEHSNFILPLNEDGMLATIQVDERKITRVKYHPPNDNSANGMWKALLDNGNHCPLQRRWPDSLGTGSWKNARNWELESSFPFLLEWQNHH